MIRAVDMSRASGMVVERDLVARLRGGLARRAGVLAGRGVRSVSLVGSLARGEGGDKSDVDLLVELAPGAAFDLVDLVELKDGLEAEVGRSVDVLFRGNLRPYVARSVEGDALPLL